MRPATFALAAITALALTACGSSTPPGPPKSAAVACRDFHAWQALSAGDVTSGVDTQDLDSAASAAPPSLFHDMDMLRLDVKTAAGFKNSQLGPTWQTEALTYVQVVRLDCLNVHGG